MTIHDYGRLCSNVLMLSISLWFFSMAYKNVFKD